MMDEVNDDICKQFQAFSIVVIWNVDFVNFCKLLSVLNNPSMLKNLIPSYRENFQHV
jgi:hypothetical protein